MPAFSELDSRTQVRELKQLAQVAAAHYGLNSNPKLVFHGYNTTFRFEEAGGKFAMRLNVNSRRTPEQVGGEVAWIEALAGDTDLTLPVPVHSSDGLPLIRLESPYFPEKLTVVLYRWLDGRHLSRRLGLGTAHKIGQLLQAMHRHGEHFQFPEGTSRPVLLDFLDSLPWNLPDKAVFNDARAEAEAAMAKLEHDFPRQITHFDVHLGNVKKQGEAVSVFDFDDSLMAWPIMDIAQSLYYLRRAYHSEAVEAAVWQGLGKRVEDYGLTTAEFEALVAGRALLLACDLMINQNSHFAALAPKFLELTEMRLEAYRKTGRFDTSLGPKLLG